MISLDSKIKEIVENPAAKEIAEKHLPGITKNPMLKMAYGMTLRSVASLRQAKQMGLTPEILAALEEDFKAIPE